MTSHSDQDIDRHNVEEDTATIQNASIKANEAINVTVTANSDDTRQPLNYSYSMTTTIEDEEQPR